MLLLLLLLLQVDEVALLAHPWPGPVPQGESSSGSQRSNTQQQEASSPNFGAVDAAATGDLDEEDPTTGVSCQHAACKQACKQHAEHHKHLACCLAVQMPKWLGDSFGSPAHVGTQAEAKEFAKLVQQVATGKHPSLMGKFHRQAITAFFTRQDLREAPGYKVGMHVIMHMLHVATLCTNYFNLDLVVAASSFNSVPLKTPQGDTQDMAKLAA
jgi:hypothetical protein